MRIVAVCLAHGQPRLELSPHHDPDARALESYDVPRTPVSGTVFPELLSAYALQSSTGRLSHYVLR
jgi:hypothetical protein